MFPINYRDPRPIYEQVKDNLRRAIITGAMKPDEKIPSVRDAAGELAINPNTIQKAYRELESEGYIYSVAGRGSFVADSSRARDERRIELFAELDKTIAELRHLGISCAEICAHVSDLEVREERA